MNERPAMWAMTTALFCVLVAPTDEARAEAAGVAAMIAKPLTPEEIRACALRDEAMADGGVPPDGGVLIDPIRSVHLHDVGGHGWIAATAIDSDGAESFVLASRREINDVTATYDVAPPSHEVVGPLDEVTWQRIWRAP